ncbi:MAG: hypothetical protein ACRCZF_27420 [Gemmataceae bacterium]
MTPKHEQQPEDGIDLLGYELQLLTDAELALVATRLRSDAELRSDHEKLQTRLAVLRQPGADIAAADLIPPSDLVLRTISTVAMHMVANPAAPEPQPGAPAPRHGSELATEVPTTVALPAPRLLGGFPLRRWVEVGTVATIGFLAIGLFGLGLQKSRHNAARLACQQQMQQLSQALQGYADTNHGSFPKVGTTEAPTAGTFVSILVESGHLAGPTKLDCPAQMHTPETAHEMVGYVYTLGHRDRDGHLIGPRRTTGEDSNTPLLADFPTPNCAPESGPVSAHGTGQNVLFMNGAIRFTRVGTVGPNNDDIYKNQHGKVKAGVHATDISLGRATDQP